MPSNFKSPFAGTFKSAIKRGTPCWTAINNIANNKKKTFNFVAESLFKGNVVNRQKFNGQWLYFPCEAGKSNATNVKAAQFNMWQSFIDWCVCNGVCTPDQIANNKGSQKEFMNYCRKFFNKQFSTSTGSKTRKSTRTSSKKSSVSRKRKPATSKKRSTTTKSKKRSTTLKFPAKSRKSSTTRTRRAA